jgi:hypothetical protein
MTILWHQLIILIQGVEGEEEDEESEEKADDVSQDEMSLDGFVNDQSFLPSRRSSVQSLTTSIGSPPPPKRPKSANNSASKGKGKRAASVSYIIVEKWKYLHLCSLLTSILVLTRHVNGHPEKNLCRSRHLKFFQLLIHQQFSQCYDTVTTISWDWSQLFQKSRTSPSVSSMLWTIEDAD